ncbi:DNA-binding response OmpR family regulator [Ensifer adhaerens]|uniref:DNA-binding response OmpR family regulator n=1 Tax=Ensifer adhaerens TaxID=106592 RepID=A0ACC5T5Q5_ENSAD|nr:response regulator [Ensifer adhaerens]MBP1876451.1 DNA-binding response OmpR family regulator [Ensifer adhaerens]
MNDDQRSVLVVEDEFLLAIQIQDDLLAAGFSVIGPFTSLRSSIAAAKRETPQAATLDVNLNGEFVYPVADELLARGVPVLLLTGYAASDLPEQYRSLPRLSKPFNSRDLIRTVEALLIGKG